MIKNKYNAEFSENQYDVWHHNDVKKRADKALADNNKELYMFLVEHLYSQSGLNQVFKVGPGEVTG